MKTTSFVINVTSDQKEAMTAFYRDVVELAPNPNIGEGAFEIAPGATFIIDGHSETKGKTKEPQRVLINFVVEDLSTEEAMTATGLSRDAVDAWRSRLRRLARKLRDELSETDGPPRKPGKDD